MTYKTDWEQFILPVENYKQSGIVTHKDTSEIHSFSLYNDDSNQEALTNDEQLELPSETTDGDTYTSQEHTTYSEMVTDSPMAVEQTISLLRETTTSSQTVLDSVTESQIHSIHFNPNTVETDGSKLEETISRGSSKEKAAVLNETTSTDGIHNEHILSSPTSVKQSVTIPTKTLTEHEKSEAELEEEHKRLSMDHREPSVDHKQHLVEHIKPLERQKPEAQHVQTLGEHNTELEGKHQWQLFSPVEFSPTSPPSNKQSHSLFNFREEEEEADNTLRTHSRMEKGELTSNACHLFSVSSAELLC